MFDNAQDQRRHSDRQHHFQFIVVHKGILSVHFNVSDLQSINRPEISQNAQELICRRSAVHALFRDEDAVSRSDVLCRGETATVSRLLDIADCSTRPHRSSVGVNDIEQRLGGDHHFESGFVIDGLSEHRPDFERTVLIEGGDPETVVREQCGWR